MADIIEIPVDMLAEEDGLRIYREEMGGEVSYCVTVSMRVPDGWQMRVVEERDIRAHRIIFTRPSAIGSA